MKIILQRISATDYLWYCAYSFFVIYYIFDDICRGGYMIFIRGRAPYNGSYL